MTQVSAFPAASAAADGDQYGIDNASNVTQKITGTQLKTFIQADLLYDKVITVAKQGGQFSTIKAAVDSASDGDRTLVRVAPDIYLEDNPITAKTYMTIKAMGERNTTRITAANANANLFISANNFFLEGFSLSSVSGSGYYGVSVTGAHAVEMKACIFYQCSGGIHINNAGASVDLVNVDLLQVSGTMGVMIKNEAGKITSTNSHIVVANAVTTVIECDGSDCISTFLGTVLYDGSNVTNFYIGKNNSRTVFYDTSVVSVYDAFVVESGADLRTFNTMCVRSRNDAFRINDVGADTNVGAYGFVVENTVGFDVNILSATGVVSGYGVAAFDKINTVPGAQLVSMLVDTKEGDEGVNVAGELHVGMPEKPAESVFGGGDSYTRGMIVYTYNPSGAVWADVSTAARSASGSTFTFPAVLQDNAIYMASSLENASDVLFHYGIKASISTAVTLGAGEIDVEYWNGSSWDHVHHLSTKSGAPYTSYAEDIFERAQSDQIRYNQAIVDDWAKADPMSYGTDLYWLRFRIATAVTTAPVFEQFKLHTNRFEANDDGMTEYFGASRSNRELLIQKELSTPLSANTPGNENVAFADTITLQIAYNSFTDSQVKGFGGLLAIPEWLDTSQPITFGVLWYADTNNAGDVELEMDIAQIEVGEPLDGSIATVNYTDVTTVAGSSQYDSKRTNFSIDVSHLVTGEAMAFRLFRDATAGNAHDTLSGKVVIAAIRAFGKYWRT